MVATSCSRFSAPENSTSLVPGSMLQKLRQPSCSSTNMESSTGSSSLLLPSLEAKKYRILQTLELTLAPAQLVS